MLYLLYTYTDPFYPSCWLEIQQGDFHWERPKPSQVDAPSEKQDQDAEDTQQGDAEDGRQQTGTLKLNNIDIQIFQVITSGSIHSNTIVLKARRTV